jgi:hypothetical protein
LDGSDIDLNTTNKTTYTGLYSGLDLEESYAVTIQYRSITDAWGNSWTASVDWTFVTGDGSGPIGDFLVDGNASSPTSLRIWWDTEDKDGIVIILSTSSSKPSISAGDLPTSATTAPSGSLGTLIRFNGTDRSEAQAIVWTGLTRETTYYIHTWSFTDDLINEEDYVQINRTTPRRKDGFVESASGTFVVSDITPMPVVEGEEAGFSIFATQGGALNVSIIDLSGAKVMDVVTDTEITENSEIRIPFTVRELSSGMYSIMISVGEDRVIRTFILNK